MDNEPLSLFKAVGEPICEPLPSTLLINLTSLLLSNNISNEVLSALLNAKIARAPAVCAAPVSPSQVESHLSTKDGLDVSEELLGAMSVVNVLLGVGAISLTLVYLYLCSHMLALGAATEADKRTGGLRISLLSFVYVGIFCSIARVVHSSGRSPVFVGILYTTAALVSPAVTYGLLRCLGWKFYSAVSHWHATVRDLKFEFHLACIIMEFTLYLVALWFYRITSFPVLLGVEFLAEYLAVLTMTLISRGFLPKWSRPSLTCITVLFSAYCWYLVLRGGQKDVAFTFIAQVTALMSMMWSLPYLLLGLRLGDTLYEKYNTLRAWIGAGKMPKGLRTGWSNILPYWLVHIVLLIYSMRTGSSMAVPVAVIGLAFTVYLSMKDNTFGVVLNVVTGLYLLLVTSSIENMVDSTAIQVLELCGLGTKTYENGMSILDLLLGMVSQSCTLASVRGGWKMISKGSLVQYVLLTSLYWFWGIATYNLTENELLLGNGGLSRVSSFVLMVMSCFMASVLLLAALLTILPTHYARYEDENLIQHALGVFGAEMDAATIPGYQIPSTVSMPISIVYLFVSAVVMRYLLVVHASMFTTMLASFFSGSFTLFMLYHNKSLPVFCVTCYLLYQGIYVFKSNALTFLGCLKAYGLLCKLVWHLASHTKYKVAVITLVVTLAAVATIHYGLQLDLKMLSIVSPEHTEQLPEERLLAYLMQAAAAIA